jgi:hypothetical protein
MCRASKEHMDKTRGRLAGVFARGCNAATIAGTLALTACVAVPVDTRTGQILWPPATNPTAPREAVPVPMPVAPSAPATYTARLYPINDIANRAGMLTAVVTDGHGGRGSFTLSYLGEAMQGEASRVENGHVGFGRIHREVLGLGAVTVQGRRGIANAFSARGVNAQCEYVLSGPSQGTGACLFSDGARYQLHFG